MHAFHNFGAIIEKGHSPLSFFLDIRTTNHSLSPWLECLSGGVRTEQVSHSQCGMSIKTFIKWSKDGAWLYQVKFFYDLAASASSGQGKVMLKVCLNCDHWPSYHTCGYRVIILYLDKEVCKYSVPHSTIKGYGTSSKSALWRQNSLMRLCCQLL